VPELLHNPVHGTAYRVVVIVLAPQHVGAAHCVTPLQRRGSAIAEGAWGCSRAPGLVHSGIHTMHDKGQHVGLTVVSVAQRCPQALSQHLVLYRSVSVAGWYAVDIFRLTAPSRSVMSRKRRLVNCVPLSLTIEKNGLDVCHQRVDHRLRAATDSFSPSVSLIGTALTSVLRGPVHNRQDTDLRQPADKVERNVRPRPRRGARALAQVERLALRHAQARAIHHVVVVQQPVYLIIVVIVDLCRLPLRSAA
jgi:hypothetical protein